MCSLVKTNKFQQVHFRDVADFLAWLPDEERKIVEVLRLLVFDCIPGVSEKLSYNVPFYRKRRTICFIWPASVLWGQKKTYDGVRFGFSNGYLLQDEVGYLEKGDRKQVYWKDIREITQTDMDMLRTFVFEASLLDKKGQK
jgi:hypothetical protein